MMCVIGTKFRLYESSIASEPSLFGMFPKGYNSKNPSILRNISTYRSGVILIEAASIEMVLSQNFLHG